MRRARRVPPGPPQPVGRYTTGVLSGIGVPLLVVAFLNRDGPAFVCTQSTATSSSACPGLLAGVLFVLPRPATYVLSATRRRSK